MDATHHHKRVLYIEDDPGSRLLVKRILESEGYLAARERILRKFVVAEDMQLPTTADSLCGGGV